MASSRLTRAANGSTMVKDLTGADFVYPGHPLVTATLIMAFYPDYASASLIGSGGFQRALEDCRIPGSGCHVGHGMYLLKRGTDGESIDGLVALANMIRETGQAGGLVDRVSSGREQARLIEPHFRDKARSWLVSGQHRPSTRPRSST